MNCTFERLDDGHWVCSECGYRTKRAYDVKPLRNCEVAVDPPIIAIDVKGVGSHLRDILLDLSVSRHGDCGCDEMLGKMNAWGPEGCREHREEILDHLRTAYDSSSLPTKALALPLAVWNGLPLTLEGLLDEAILRSESAKASETVTPEALAALATS